jgi:hypothetical protein
LPIRDTVPHCGTTLRYFIYGRTGRFDVVEVPDSLPNIVGQIPLEDLDWVVD